MVTYTAIIPNNDVVTRGCHSLDHALALATIDLHRDYTPARIIAGRQRLDIERILVELVSRRERLRRRALAMVGMTE